MKPFLPRKTTTDVDRIKMATWNQLLACLDYAMEHPRGDGHTIRNNGDGVLSANGRNGGTGGGASSEEYNGPFKAVVKEESIRIVDGANPASGYAGYVYAGSRTFRIPTVSFPLAPCDIVVWVSYTEGETYGSGTFAYGISLQGEIGAALEGTRIWSQRIASAWASTQDDTAVVSVGQVWEGGDVRITDRWLS